MGLRFYKRLKISDLIRLNLSKSGPSVSIGKKGASINIGGKGTFLNLSPAALGIKGTGVSYRKKISGKAVKEALKENKDDKTEKKSFVYKEDVNKKEAVTDENLEVIRAFRNELEANTNMHKYASKVMNEEEFKAHTESLEEEKKKTYELSMEGDEDTVESLIGSFMANLVLTYKADASYELEDDVLYVDLDLPEIEMLKTKYPVLSSGEVSYKNKTAAELKEEYARTVMSLGIFLADSFFNLSSYIKTIVMSAYTSLRDKNGDLKDTYLYSVKYKRDVYENCVLSKVESPYEFLLQFENRINYSPSNHTFKAITPYGMNTAEEPVKAPKKEKEGNVLLEDAVLGLKALGYKSADVKKVLPELEKTECTSSADYLKEGLKLLGKQSQQNK